MQLASSSLLLRPVHDVPAFARELAWARLEAPFRAGVAVIRRAPDEVVLTARIHLPAATAVPVHWEIARDAHMKQRERYGLIAVRTDESLRLVLEGLEADRPYWYRLWAGGHWSRTGRFSSSARRRVHAGARVPTPRVARSLQVLHA